MSVKLSGLQVQTMHNLILLGDEVEIVQGPSTAVIVKMHDRELVIDIFGGFAWRYL